jgi:hypothetical protein
MLLAWVSRYRHTRLYSAKQSAQYQNLGEVSFGLLWVRSDGKDGSRLLVPF